jgi:hypothetical protein
MGSGASNAKRLKKRENRRLRRQHEPDARRPGDPVIAVTADDIDRAWWIGHRIANTVRGEAEFKQALDRECRSTWPADADRALAAAARSNFLMEAVSFARENIEKLREEGVLTAEIDVQDAGVLTASAAFPLIWTGKRPELEEHFRFFEFLGSSAGGASAHVAPVALGAPLGE